MVADRIAVAARTIWLLWPGRSLVAECSTTPNCSKPCPFSSLAVTSNGWPEMLTDTASTDWEVSINSMTTKAVAGTRIIANRRQRTRPSLAGAVSPTKVMLCLQAARRGQPRTGVRPPIRQARMLRCVAMPIRSATPDRNLPADEPDYTAQHSVSRLLAKPARPAPSTAGSSSPASRRSGHRFRHDPDRPVRHRSVIAGRILCLDLGLSRLPAARHDDCVPTRRSKGDLAFVAQVISRAGTLWADGLVTGLVVALRIRRP